MTEKRFTHKEDDWEILDNGKHFAFAHSGYQAEKICELLNELSTENQQLKKQLQSEHIMLDNAILLERTRMGQSALKQYKEAIQ
jgi:hypothetical protein